MFILKLLLFIFILGIIILVHEFGHFIWAKTFGVHIYEFSIGMGPIIHTHKGKKDKIDYNIRAIPIGGFVAMAGEIYDDDEKISKKKLLCNKPGWQRLIILVAGVMNNFILAILLFMAFGFFWEGTALKPTIYAVSEASPAEAAGIKEGDTILSINGYKTGSWDKAQIILYYKNVNEYSTFVVKHKDGTKETIQITPEIIKDETTGEERPLYGISIKGYDSKYSIKAIPYGFAKYWATMETMGATIWGLISGKISLNALSGPVGIYQIVGESFDLKFGDAIRYVIFLIAYLSVNVGFINILPFPAFDGGHVLFLIIEKLKGSPVNAKLESIITTIGFILIFGLMILVTIKDIIKLF